MKIEIDGQKRSKRGIVASKKMVMSIFAVLIVGTLIASAGLLLQYGSLTTTAEVRQSVQIRGGGEDGWHDHNEPVIFDVPTEYPGGQTFCFKFWVKDWTRVPAPIWFGDSVVTATDADGNWMCPAGVSNPPSFCSFPSENTVLELTSKDSEWMPDERMEATLTFDPISPTFDYTLTVIGLAQDEETEYALIYYADKPDRFVDWGGDNLGIVIDTFVVTGNNRPYHRTGSVELNRNMPDGDDQNIYPGDEYYNYNNGHDDFEHWQGGAKIWIVPTADLTDGNSLPLIAWNQDQYLFETDLVTYSDCDLEDVPWTMALWGTRITEATILPGEEVPFFVCYSFALNVSPGTYVISTTIDTAES